MEEKTQTKTKMTSGTVWITPEIARDYLHANVENRRLRSQTINSLAERMESGKWKENGESIIFDVDGVLRDGQHRLASCILARHSFWAVVVRGVENDVIDTIDIGKNRTLEDILYLNGITSAALMASTTKAIIIYNRRALSGNQGSKKVLNQVGLAYCLKHREIIKSYINVAQKINQKSSRVSTNTFIASILHITAKGKPITEEHEDFIKRICGINVVEGTGTAWFFKTIEEAKKNQVRLHDYWKMGILMKIWNLYVQGDAAVRYVKFDTETPFPDVL